MKINEVEQKVGITKKNIRFYEEQGLLHPDRNQSNGYRDYSEADVELLRKIKLLRRLAVPIEEIRRILEGRLSLSDCLERHEITLKREASNLEQLRDMCARLSTENLSFATLDAEAYLTELEELEQGGSRFMDVKDVDVRKRKQGAVIAAVVMEVLLALLEIVIIALCITDPPPVVFMIFILIMPLAVIVGINIALRERMREIKGGELDEARKY